jgi:hypothetical protein
MNFDQIAADIEALIPKQIPVIDFFKPKLVRSVNACDNCTTGQCFFDETMFADICTSCGNMKYRLIEPSPAMQETPIAPVYCIYLKINHFKEVLIQMQGKEQTTISPTVVTKVRAEMHRLQLQSIGLLQIRAILKHLKLAKYYEHSVYLLEKLGQIVPHLTAIEQEHMMKQFILIQGSYQKSSPTKRVNFLNYYFLLYKLCQMNGHTTCLQFIPMLSTRALTIENDSQWRTICMDLGWEFTPTI